MENRVVHLVETQKEKLLKSFLRMKTTYPANCLAFKNTIILFNNPVLYDTVIPYYSIRVDNSVIGIKTHEYKQS